MLLVTLAGVLLAASPVRVESVDCPSGADVEQLLASMLPSLPAAIPRGRAPGQVRLRSRDQKKGPWEGPLEDVEGATEDLKRYLEPFPKGAHAPWARRWLESRVQVPINDG